jgi:phosphohistidine phosphatase
MKTLIIIRHAKSKDPSFGQADFDRTLTKSGEEDAKHMAQNLIHRKIKVDEFVASAAKRTQLTARVFIKELVANESNLISEINLYEAAVPNYYKVVEKLDDDWQTVVLFGHNPGITYFINSLDTQIVNHMPPAGMYAVTIDINSWKDFSTSQKVFSFFETVKGGENNY